MNSGDSIYALMVGSAWTKHMTTCSLVQKLTAYLKPLQVSLYGKGIKVNNVIAMGVFHSVVHVRKSVGYAYVLYRPSSWHGHQRDWAQTSCAGPATRRGESPQK